MTYQQSLTTRAQADLSPNRSRLYVVATPIGNLGDLSARAREVLTQADAICAEDTRVFRHLCKAAGLSTTKRLVSLHAHNEMEKIAEVTSLLQQNLSVALVSDAGTPGLSDPGQRLVAELSRQGFESVAVPGPSALTAALSIGGLRPEDDEPIMFWGFLPARKKQRQDQLARLALLPGLSVFFESPHRILGCLEDALLAFNEGSQVVVARELTKRFETCLRGSLMEVAAKLKAQKQATDAQAFKGEFVVLVKNLLNHSGHETATAFDPSEQTLQPYDLVWLKSLCRHCPKPLAAKLAAQALGLSREQAYRLVLQTQS
jgi:16S rRNA (cytidine1402-2'-O)-methyltransferase